MGTLEILRHALNNIQEFSKTEIEEESFRKIIGELKATMFKIRDRITDENLLFQLDEIIDFQIVSQKTSFDQKWDKLFSRHKYKRPFNSWDKKGKYLYDLDQIELKLGGLIYKIEHEQLNQDYPQ